MNKKRVSLKGSLLLLLTATIWGIAFVAQSVGMNYVGPFTFTSIRSLIGAAVLVPCLFFLRYLRSRNRQDMQHVKAPSEDGEDRFFPEDMKEPKETAGQNMLLRGGLCCGVLLCVASNLQQIGIHYTTVGKAGFITALYIVLVPILGIFLGKRAGLRIWVSVVLAVFGLYLLCITETLRLGLGDAFVLLCAFVFAFQIMSVDYFSPRTEGVKLACLEFLVCGILSAVPMFLFEKPAWADICAAGIPILYAGVLSSGVAYTLQIIAQKDMDPTVASLIMSLESVISALAGWAILHQTMGMRELAGCMVMFGAIILAQLPERNHHQIEKHGN